MITKDLVKSEIDRVGRPDEAAWKESLAGAYGSTANAPLERGQQGSYEVREPLK